MLKHITAIAIATLLATGAGQAFAKDTPQQGKMATCNKDAADKKGDERKAFMKDCLSAKPVAAAASGTPQQNKMKTCNADPKAKALKGDERKAFMKQCLSA